MPGKEIDPIRARSALEVIRQHPGLALFVASPALIVVGVIFALGHPIWATLALIAFVLGGAWLIVRKR